MQDILRKYGSWIAVAVVILIGLGVYATRARAADKGGPSLPPILSDAPYDAKPVWTGLYVGGNAGIVAGIVDPIFGVDGYQGGVQIGALLQMGRLIVGAEASYDWKKVQALGTNINAHQWDYSGRLGVLVTDHTLLYAKLSRPTLTIDSFGGGNSAGIGFGGGMETMIARNWSIAAEYERDTFDKISTGREHIVSVRVNYHIPVLGKLSP